MATIFIDESGQFTSRDGEEYFVIGSFTVGNPRRTEKAFRSWHKSKFPKRMRGQSEIKFSEVNIDKDLRLRTVKYISQQDVRINYVYLRKENIPIEYWKRDKLESGLLYVNIIAETLEMYLPTSDDEFRVFCDKRHLKGITPGEFKKILTNRLLPQLPTGSIIQIEMIDSTTNANIQIADWISGSIAYYLHKRPLGQQYFELLGNNLLEKEGKELFRRI
jgi:hypothetical protein